jgi:hypothetical protein
VPGSLGLQGANGHSIEEMKRNYERQSDEEFKAWDGMNQRGLHDSFRTGRGGCGATDPRRRAPRAVLVWLGIAGLCSVNALASNDFESCPQQHRRSASSWFKVRFPSNFKEE